MGVGYHFQRFQVIPEFVGREGVIKNLDTGLSFALVWAEVVETVACRTTIRPVGRLQTGRDHLLGHVFEIRLFFLCFFTLQAYRMVIVYG